MTIGEGLVAIWHQAAPETEAEFLEWHNREHMPERLGIPGFLRGRRSFAVDAHPRWLTLYETESVGTLAGPDYVARLNAPTPWTKKMVPTLTGTARSLCRIRHRAGHGVGGYTLGIGFDLPKDREADTLAWLENDALPAVLALPAVSGTTLAYADRDASSVETEEKKGRNDAVPTHVVLVEATTEAALAAAVEAVGPKALEARGATGLFGGSYRLSVLLAHGEGG
jgi:hypothetical protein